MLPILATAVRRCAAEKAQKGAADEAQPRAAAPESSKRPEQYLLLVSACAHGSSCHEFGDHGIMAIIHTENNLMQGILPDELQAMVEQMEELNVARPAAVAKGRAMLSAIGQCVVAGVADIFKIVPFMLGAGTRVPQFDRFVPTEYNPTRYVICQ